MKKIYDKVMDIIWTMFVHFIGIGSIIFSSFGWYSVLTEGLGNPGMFEMFLITWWLTAVPLVSIGYIDEIIKGTIRCSKRKKTRG